MFQLQADSTGYTSSESVIKYNEIGMEHIYLTTSEEHSFLFKIYNNSTWETLSPYIYDNNENKWKTLVTKTFNT